MVLFGIPDIRLFWSTDPRFLSQFRSGEITMFKPYSRYPPCYKDMSFWLPPGAKDASGAAAGSGAGGKDGEAVAGVSCAGGKGKLFHENDYCEIVREVAGDLVETVTLVS
jgi:phenylalanyl-tRNA synthetase alpha chain